MTTNRRRELLGRLSRRWPSANSAGSGSIDSTRALQKTFWGVAILWCAFEIGTYLVILLARPEATFQDARLYFRATTAWLDGADPWAVSQGGVVFAGIPPTLLLNLPLVPFGEDAAFVFWPIAGLLGMVAAIRRFGLSPLWLLWPPVLEGWLAGSPDHVLLGLTVVGGGAIAALTKPYTAPALLGQGRIWAVAVGGALGLATFVLLPWPRYVATWPAIVDTLATQASNLSAWGMPVLMVITAVALVRLGRQGVELATPGLWPHSQMHYALFSIRVAATSPILAIGLAFPIPGAPAVAIVVHAVAQAASSLHRERAGATRAAGGTAGRP